MSPFPQKVPSGPFQEVLSSEAIAVLTSVTAH